MRRKVIQFDTDSKSKIFANGLNLNNKTLGHIYTIRIHNGHGIKSEAINNNLFVNLYISHIGHTMYQMLKHPQLNDVNCSRSCKLVMWQQCCPWHSIHTGIVFRRWYWYCTKICNFFAYILHFVVSIVCMSVCGWAVERQAEWEIWKHSFAQTKRHRHRKMNILP